MNIIRRAPLGRSAALIEAGHAPGRAAATPAVAPNGATFSAPSNVEGNASPTGPQTAICVADRLDDDRAGAEGARVTAMDHRATIRVAVGVDAEVALLHHPSRIYRAETLDVSPAGARFLLREPLPIGTVVQFRCLIPGRRQPVSINVEATIRSHSELLSNDTVLARDVYRHCADFAPLPTALEDAIVSALLFIETRHS